MFHITLCGTITPRALKFGHPRENGLFVAVLTSDCNFFLLKDFFPCEQVPGSAGIGARSLQGHVPDDEVQGGREGRGGGLPLLADAVLHGAVAGRPQQKPREVSVQEPVRRARQSQVLPLRGHLLQADLESVRHVCKRRTKNLGSSKNQRATRRQSDLRTAPTRVPSARPWKGDDRSRCLRGPDGRQRGVPAQPPPWSRKRRTGLWGRWTFSSLAQHGPLEWNLLYSLGREPRFCIVYGATTGKNGPNSDVITDSCCTGQAGGPGGAPGAAGRASRGRLGPRLSSKRSTRFPQRPAARAPAPAAWGCLTAVPAFCRAVGGGQRRAGVPAWASLHGDRPTQTERSEGFFWKCRPRTPKNCGFQRGGNGGGRRGSFRISRSFPKAY